MRLVILALLVVATGLAQADCNTTNCFGGDVCCGSLQGRCISDPVLFGVAEYCVCSEQYAGPDCSVLRKNGFWHTFLAGVFGLWGIDCFYLGRVGEGIAKLFFGLFSTALLILGTGLVIVIYKGIAGGSSDTQCVGGFCAVLGLLMALVGFFLWLVYFILAAKGSLPDHHGYDVSWSLPKL